MHGRNCKLIVIKPTKRGTYRPSKLMTGGIEEAKRRGIPVEEFMVNWGERERGPNGGTQGAAAAQLERWAQARHVGNRQGGDGVSWRSEKPSCPIRSAMMGSPSRSRCLYGSRGPVHDIYRPNKDLDGAE